MKRLQPPIEVFSPRVQDDRRRILVIAPPFFGYYRQIAEEFAAQGYTVDCIDDRPNTSAAYKILQRKFRLLARPFIRGHFKNVLEVIANNQYDFVLVVGGMSYAFNRGETRELNAAASSKLYLYLWDSLDNCPMIKDSIPEFRAVATFDERDSNSRGISYLPLFIPGDVVDFRKSHPDASSYKYDAIFIGSVHQIEKLRAIQQMVKELSEENASVFTYYYIPSPIVALILKLAHAEYRQTDIETTPLSREKVLNAIYESKTVLDSPQASQSGFTIRSLEAIGMGCKLLTTNPSARELTRVMGENVKSFSPNDEDTVPFVRGDPAEYPPVIVERLILSNWTRSLLDTLGIREEVSGWNSQG